MARAGDWITRLRTIAPERFLLLALALLAAGLWTWAYRVLPRPLQVTIFAVGDGDAILIRAPFGRTVLLDAGSRSEPQVGDRILVPNLMLLGVRRLDAVLISHPDSDHINALPAVLDAVPAGVLLDPALPCDTATYQRLLAQVAGERIPCRPVRAGDRLNLGDGATLRVLAPANTLLQSATSDTNANSVVCLLQYRRSRLLLAGDLSEDGERALLAQGVDLQADVLKVAHHGSHHSTTEAFLDAVRPSYAVISAGGTDGDHPHRDTLARLRAAHAAILRTDTQGQLRLTSDGEHWRIRTFRGE